MQQCPKCRNSGVVYKANEVWGGVFWCDCPVGLEGERRESQIMRERPNGPVAETNGDFYI